MAWKISLTEPHSAIVSVASDLDLTKIGKYTIRYSASFFFGQDSCERNIIIKDTTPPEITLVSNPDSFTVYGQKYEEEGFTAVDNYDGDITSSVTRTDNGDRIVYSVKDSSGNETTITRDVNVKDIEAPKITLVGEEYISIMAGTSFTDTGATAIDNVDGDITSKIKVSGSVDVYLAGTYTLEYSVSDTFGNKSSVTRTVTVTPISIPSGNDKVSGKTIYLTFDDGPSQYTEGLLDTLAKYNAKATFFVVNAGNMDILAREKREGHAIGIHSATHDYAKIYANEDSYFRITSGNPRQFNYRDESANIEY